MPLRSGHSTLGNVWRGKQGTRSFDPRVISRKIPPLVFSGSSFLSLKKQGNPFCPFVKSDTMRLCSIFTKKTNVNIKTKAHFATTRCELPDLTGNVLFCLIGNRLGLQYLKRSWNHLPYALTIWEIKDLIPSNVSNHSRIGVINAGMGYHATRHASLHNSIPPWKRTQCYCQAGL